eukprot:symbB.v1.2.037650.t1/scaffold5618.1/size25298/2
MGSTRFRVKQKLLRRLADDLPIVISGVIMGPLNDLPTLDFQHFDAAFARLRSAREALGNHVKNCENLHENIDRQLRDLQTARPKVEPHIYKEKLLAAESLYAEVKAQREQFASAEAEAKEKTQKAEACSSKLKTLNEELRRYDQELHEMRTQRRDKESKAATLRSKANLPGLEDRKRQIADDIKNNLDEAKLLQAAEGSHLDWRKLHESMSVNLDT